jgi:hypothetical protein
MRKQLCATWLAFGTALFVPVVAHAEDEPKPYPECTKAPTDSETAAAKGAYQAGNASFDEADYPRAITYWEDAYRRDCTANLLLKNLARAYELYGQKRQAVVALETYLVREPTSSDKDQIQRRIEVLKKQITSEKVAAPAAGTQTPATTTAPPPPPPVNPEPAPADHAGKRPILPLIVVGVGGAVFVGGVILYLVEAKDVKNFEAQCPNHYCGTGAAAVTLQNNANSARSKKIVGGVLTGVGAAAIAGGLVWYFLSPRSAGTTTAGSLKRPHVDPTVTPGFAGVALSGAF